MITAALCVADDSRSSRFNLLLRSTSTNLALGLGILIEPARRERSCDESYAVCIDSLRLIVARYRYYGSLETLLIKT